MTNIKNPSISITLFSPERLLCWPRRSVSTKRASLWNTSWPLSTSSPVLYRIPTAEQVTTLIIITSSAPHTNSWTSGASDRPQHHQFCTAHQQLNKWNTWSPTTSSPALHHTPTTEQVVQLTTLNIISSAPHPNWTSEATDYPQHHQFCTTPQLNKWSNWLPSISPVLHHTPTEQQVKQLTTLNIISSAPHTNWTTSEASDYPQHHQFCTTHQLNKWSNWLPSISSPVLHHTPAAEQVEHLATLNIITSSALHTNNWTTSGRTDYPQHHHQFCTAHSWNTSGTRHGHPQNHHQFCTRHQQLNA